MYVCTQVKLMTEWQYVTYFTLKVKTRKLDHYVTASVYVNLSGQTFWQSIGERRECSREHFVKFNFSPLELICPLKYLCR